MVLALAACGSARVIQRNASGGVIELQGDRGKAMEDANSQMASHCGPGNYRIDSEGEEVIGQDTVSRTDEAQDTKTSRSGRRSSTDTTSTNTTSTRNATAWRIHYSCGGAGGPPPGPAGGPPADPNAGGAPPPGY
ncbi:MAG: hypothetical protein KF773_12565 [Deltaproteobacteria bacterium]|nr:hypothetical protein [Deltaproteobacteria bacterium]MCW5808857.1 hypothetical protein [Deltaproteobacteria bacterium]